jgi:hypothetical protein
MSRRDELRRIIEQPFSDLPRPDEFVTRMPAGVGAVELQLTPDQLHAKEKLYQLWSKTPQGKRSLIANYEVGYVRPPKRSMRDSDTCDLNDKERLLLKMILDELGSAWRLIISALYYDEASCSPAVMANALDRISSVLTQYSADVQSDSTGPWAL